MISCQSFSLARVNQQPESTGAPVGEVYGGQLSRRNRVERWTRQISDMQMKFPLFSHVYFDMQIDCPRSLLKCRLCFKRRRLDLRSRIAGTFPGDAVTSGARICLQTSKVIIPFRETSLVQKSQLWSPACKGNRLQHLINQGWDEARVSFFYVLLRELNEPAFARVQGTWKDER